MEADQTHPGLAWPGEVQLHLSCHEWRAGWEPPTPRGCFPLGLSLGVWIFP